MFPPRAESVDSFLLQATGGQPGSQARTSESRKPVKRPSPAINPATLPDEYCVRLDGNCLEPDIPDGAAVYLKKSEAFGAGDVVCIWFRPEFSPQGHSQGWVKRVRLNVPHWVKSFPYNDHPESDVKAILVVEQSNPPRSYAVHCDRILAIHKAVGYSPSNAKIGDTVSSADMLPIGKAVA
jgi:hypothetical protein